MEEKLPIMRMPMEAESLRIEFTDREISASGGVSLLKQLLDRSGILGILASLPLPIQGSNRRYSPLQLLVHFWVALWCGASRFEHLEQVLEGTALDRNSVSSPQSPCTLLETKGFT
ncbi:MAG: hypothetical protein JXA28_05660 [Bacteroidetes bacterium]|nr:hypothetical protein [Bacteroidota bacterium]